MRAAGTMWPSCAGLALAFLTHSAFAADLKPGATQLHADAPAGSCLRWVWQELSWYDDCWTRHRPYVGRSGRVLRPGSR